MRSKTALRRDPSKPQTGGGLTQSLQRLSPGVYRDAGGRLTNQSGRALPQQPNRQPQMPPRGPAPYQRGNNMDRTAVAISGQGPATDPGFMQTSIGQPAQLPPGSNAYDYAGAMTGQQPEQPGMVNLPAQMPQPSANMGGQYRLSPGVYGTREQAMQQMYQPIPGLQNGLGQQGYMPPIDWTQMVNYPASMPQQPQQQQQMPTRQQMFRKY
jgi:hypothetical protein